MKKFILAYFWAKEFNTSLYYCNARKEYFNLGHFMPGKCCDLCAEFGTDPVRNILIQHVIDLSSERDKRNEEMIALKAKLQVFQLKLKQK